MMKPSDIARLRLVSQRLVRSSLKDPGQIVSWMGAMQAQDLPMSLWAVGVRMRRPSLKKVAAALDAGSILRTHVLRPTWHLVPAADLGWMLDLTAAEVRQGVAARHRQLGLTSRAISKSHAIIERTIKEAGHATRGQVVEALVNGGFLARDNRMAHLLMLAELDQIICSGPFRDGESTYALMSERVARPVRMDRDESLATLVTRYLTSRGPATMRDYAWWSGLPMAEVRRSFGLVRDRFIAKRIDGTEYWFRPELREMAGGDEVVRLLPAYDEITIAYADRSSAIDDRLERRAISSNGVFRPLIVSGGRVIGTWRRTISKGTLVVEATVFGPCSARTVAALETAAEGYGRFLGEAVGLRIERARPPGPAGRTGGTRAR